MKKVIIFFVLSLLVCSPLIAKLNTSGNMRTRMTYWNDLGTKDMQSSNSVIDTRLRVLFENAFDDNLKANLQLEVGDIVWGDEETGGATSTDAKIVEVKHANMEYNCKRLGVNLKVGLQAWNDHRSIIFDDDFAAIMFTTEVADMNLTFGTAKLREGLLSKDDDCDLFIVHADSKKMFGADIVYKRDAVRDNNMHKIYHDSYLWIMPYFTLNSNQFTFDLTAAYNRSNMKKRNPDGKDYESNGLAFAAKTSYDDGIHVEFDAFYSTGADFERKEDDADTAFNTISDYYMNGLEIFGYGACDDSRTYWQNSSGFFGETKTGILSLVLSGNAPITDIVKLNAAIGIVQASSTPKRNNKEVAKDVATEFNIGTTVNLYETLNLDFVFGYAMMGDFYKEMNGMDKDFEDIIKIATRLQFKF